MPVGRFGPLLHTSGWRFEPRCAHRTMLQFETKLTCFHQWTVRRTAGRLGGGLIGLPFASFLTTPSPPMG